MLGEWPRASRGAGVAGRESVSTGRAGRARVRTLAYATQEKHEDMYWSTERCRSPKQRIVDNGATVEQELRSHEDASGERSGSLALATSDWRARNGGGQAEKLCAVVADRRGGNWGATSGERSREAGAARSRRSCGGKQDAVRGVLYGNCRGGAAGGRGELGGEGRKRGV